MSGYRSVSISNHLNVFIGEYVRVLTNSSHYRGKCTRIDNNNNNVILKDVFKKTDTGWAEISDQIIIMGHSIESVYIEKSFPFDSNESLILSIEEGSLVPGSDPALEGLNSLGKITLPEDEL